MKEHSKLYRARSDKKGHELGKRMSMVPDKNEEFKGESHPSEKRKNLGDGKSQII
jgi:hypothetical protein